MTSISTTLARQPSWPGFLQANLEYWSNHGLPRAECNGSPILVDLMTPSIPHCFGNLLVAKILQRHKRGPIHVLTSDQKMTALALSFGVTDVHRGVQTVPPVMSANANALLEQFDELRGEGLRRKLRALNYKGLPIGPPLYDSLVRVSLLPTIDTLSDVMRTSIVSMVQGIEFAKWLFEKHDFAFFLTSHPTYYNYMVFAYAGLLRDVPTILHYEEHGAQVVRTFRKLSDFRTTRDFFSPEALAEICEMPDEDAADVGWAQLSQRFASPTEINDHYRLSYGDGKTRLERDDFANAIGAPKDRPIVFLIVQILFDAVGKGSKEIFTDHHDWLVKTLEVAGQITDVTWVVRDHPNSRKWDENQTANTIASPYAKKYAHIHLCPDDVGMETVAKTAHAAVTFNNSALELAAQGVPCILLNRNILHGHGVAHEVDSETDYYDLLRNLHAVAPMTEDQIATARKLAYAFLNARVRSTIIPRFRFDRFLKTDFEPYLAAATSNLRSIELETDPLVGAIDRMVESGFSHALPVHH